MSIELTQYADASPADREDLEYGDISPQVKESVKWASGAAKTRRRNPLRCLCWSVSLVVVCAIILVYTGIYSPNEDVLTDGLNYEDEDSGAIGNDVSNEEQMKDKLHDFYNKGHHNKDKNMTHEQWLANHGFFNNHKGNGVPDWIMERRNKTADAMKAKIERWNRTHQMDDLSDGFIPQNQNDHLAPPPSSPPNKNNEEQSQQQKYNNDEEDPNNDDTNDIANGNDDNTNTTETVQNDNEENSKQDNAIPDEQSQETVTDQSFDISTNYTEAETITTSKENDEAETQDGNDTNNDNSSPDIPDEVDIDKEDTVDVVEETDSQPIYDNSGSDTSTVTETTDGQQQQNNNYDEWLNRVVTKDDGVMYEVVDQFPHSPDGFTQGLTYYDGKLFESDGLYGRSSVRLLNPDNGDVIANVPMDGQYFAEGMTFYKDTLIQITWKKKKGFIYQAHDVGSWTSPQEFDFETTNGEGWGITYDSAKDELIVTDGTNNLHFWDPQNPGKNKRPPVPVNRINSNNPANKLNEIEMWRGHVLANVWYEDVLLVINPETGVVTKEYDFSQIYPKNERNKGADCFNGISISAQEDILYVTGKMWDRIFKIKLLP